MDVGAFLAGIQDDRFYSGQIAHVEVLPERPPRFGDVPGGLRESTVQALREGGVEQLYTHQAEAIGRIRDGEDVVVVTGTASGKTLCYTIPVIETLMDDSRATMLFLYPTKALAQDQLRNLESLQHPELGIQFLGGTYDGDTPQNARGKIRDNGNVILTNPDMLHTGILPNNPRWNRFFAHLKYVVIDEVHAYRGVFGSHLANVMRRLRRVCGHYGSTPQFICSSATIANPVEHAHRVCGVPMSLVDDDGSPRGPKWFVMWNPPPLDRSGQGTETDWRVGGERRSPVGEAITLMSTLVREQVQTISFVRTRLASELIFKGCRERLTPFSGKLANAVHAYRGGYLPEERREIERRLSEKDILGVSSTNALELGIDIGSLDACILVGYPGTIASTWQQAGRAGRGQEASVVFLLAQNSPMDQFLMTNAGYLFAQNPEQAVVDPDNPHIVVGHLQCAANEMPLKDDEIDLFGPYTSALLEILEEDGQMRHLRDTWYWSSAEYPSRGVSLRNISGETYTIEDSSDEKRVIGTMDATSALSQLHDHAVYLHGAETYFVEKLDTEQKVAHVTRQDLDYYTQAVTSSEIQLDGTDEERDWQGGKLGYGDVTVSTTIPMFRKIRFHSRDSLGFEDLELPPQTLETVAFWFTPPEDLVEAMKADGMVVGEALIGIANGVVEVAPLFVMCDVQDIGAVVDVKNLGRDALFVHDRHPGGMGYASRCMEQFEAMMQTARDVIRDCACEDGCPSCVGAATPAFAMTDLDSGVRGRIPDKKAAGFLLGKLLG